MKKNVVLLRVSTDLQDFDAQKNGIDRYVKENNIVVHKTIEALAHYLEVLTEGITTGEEQAEFESEIFEVFDDNNF